MIDSCHVRLPGRLLAGAVVALLAAATAFAQAPKAAAVEEVLQSWS